MESIRVFAPASVANVSCGYDIFGFAIHEKGDEIILKKRHDSKLVITEIKGADLPTRPDLNVATVAISSLLNHLGSDQGFDISITKLINPGSGLGSSASSASGATFAASALLETGYNKHELVPYAMDGEIVASQKAHADNIAPSMIGGFTVVRSCEPKVDVFQIPYPKDLKVLIIFPQVEIKTSEAKRILGNTVDLGKAREQWGNVAGMVMGMSTGNWDLIKRSMVDVVAEPLRKKLIPHYDSVRDIVLDSGAIGFNISGSGPTMFGFYRDEEQARGVIPAIKTIYDRVSINCMFHISEINEKGTHILD